MWVLPTLLTGLAWVVGARLESRSPRRRALFLLGALVFALFLFLYFILTNPYGRELNSSMAAFAMLPVVVALAVLAVVHAKEPELRWGYYPLAPARCPICGAETFFDFKLSSRVRGVGWRCQSGGSAHYWEDRGRILKENIALKHARMWSSVKTKTTV